MKKILFLTISLLLTGCCASRQTAKSAETGSRDTVTAESTETATDRTEQTQTAAEQERDEEVITVTTIYDTSLPTDPATRTPPVKVHTTQLRRNTTKARQESKIESRESEAQTASKEKAEHAERDTLVETTDRRGMNPAQRFLCTIGLLAFAGLAGWFLWQWFKH